MIIKHTRKDLVGHLNLSFIINRHRSSISIPTSSLLSRLLSSILHEEILIEIHRNTTLRLLTDPLTHIGIAKRVLTTLLFRIRR
ncbi:MAG: hypothetical protein ACK55Z_28260, partial [bacterium]